VRRLSDFPLSSIPHLISGHPPGTLTMDEIIAAIPSEPPTHDDTRRAMRILEDVGLMRAVGEDWGLTERGESWALVLENVQSIGLSRRGIVSAAAALVLAMLHLREQVAPYN